MVMAMQEYLEAEGLPNPETREEIILNSFIISTTSLGDLWGWKLTKEQFEDHHVLFQEDGGDVYLGKLFARLKIS